jgi:serine/threonine protein phosphatase 1
MTTWAVGDIHGNIKALEQVFKLAKDKLTPGDTIVFLGDYVDGWKYSFECIEFILSLKETYNVICITGNHDTWFLEFLNTGVHPVEWKYGGEATKTSYENRTEEEIERHRIFFRNLPNYYIDTERNNCFVHGGFNRHEEFKGQIDYIYYWDRDLIQSAMSYENSNKTHSFKIKTNFNRIFIGHTDTLNWNTTDIIKAANIYDIDTGAGYSGRLTMINTETLEVIQSFLAMSLYGDNERSLH